jgi:putative ABC transport system permease protein
VVGVVADVRQYNLAGRAPASISGAMYMPYSQSVQADHQIPSVMNLLVKTAGVSPQTGDQLYRLASDTNLNVPVGKVVHLQAMAGDSISNLRSITWIFIAFAIVALILAAIGIYGLVSYSVSQRTYEISVRMAIGAGSGSVVRMILFQSLRIALFGVASGLIVAFLGTRALSDLLVEVAPTDPLVYMAVAVFLFVVAMAASSGPAWRASRIDPIRALRAE